MNKTTDKSKSTAKQGIYKHFKTTGDSGRFTAADNNQPAAVPSRKQVMLRKAHIGNFFAGPHCFMGIGE